MGNLQFSSQAGEDGSLELDELDKPQVIISGGDDSGTDDNVELLLYHGIMDKQPISNTREIVENRWKSRFFILMRGAIFYYNIDFEQVYDLSYMIGAELGIHAACVIF
jgi:hypothetical protein